MCILPCLSHAKNLVALSMRLQVWCWSPGGLLRTACLQSPLESWRILFYTLFWIGWLTRELSGSICFQVLSPIPVLGISCGFRGLRPGLVLTQKALLPSVLSSQGTPGCIVNYSDWSLQPSYFSFLSCGMGFSWPGTPCRLASASWRLASQLSTAIHSSGFLDCILFVLDGMFFIFRVGSILLDSCSTFAQALHSTCVLFFLSFFLLVLLSISIHLRSSVGRVMPFSTISEMSFWWGLLFKKGMIYLGSQLESSHWTVLE